MNKCIVVNVTKDTADSYVGRGGGSLFGNPFKGLSRPEAIREFKTYFDRRLRTDPAFLSATLALRGKRIGCWCLPLPCHATVIADFVNAVENAAQTNPAMPGAGNTPFQCSVCTALYFTQLPNRHAQCPDCGRWYCPTHLPTTTHACKR
jgi:hypothetical protein